MTITITPQDKTEKHAIEPLAVSTKDAARLLGVSERTVATLAEKGLIQRKKVGWRSLFVVQSLKQFLEKDSPDTSD